MGSFADQYGNSAKSQTTITDIVEAVVVNSVKTVLKGGKIDKVQRAKERHQDASVRF
jgi:hypothetical protein